MKHLVFSKILTVNSKTYSVQQFRFKNSTECTAHYNTIVSQYEDIADTPISYGLNDWTTNNLMIHKKPINITRFGTTVQIIKGKEALDFHAFFRDLPELYQLIKANS